MPPLILLLIITLASRGVFYGFRLEIVIKDEMKQHLVNLQKVKVVPILRKQHDAEDYYVLEASFLDLV